MTTGTYLRSFQPRLPLGVERFRPLMSVESVKLELVDYDTDDVVALAWSKGSPLGWVWNISAVHNGRPAYRFLTSAVREFKAQTSPRRPLDWNRVTREVCPGTLPWLTTGEIERALNCEADHVLELVRSAALKLMPHTDYGQGRGNCAKITVTSFLQFLKDRREL